MKKVDDNLIRYIREVQKFFSETRASKGQIYLFIVGIDDYDREEKLNWSKDETLFFLNMCKTHAPLKKKNVYSY